ncbi:MAG: alpha/beta hydrolase [Actinomycetes bacterium]
MSETVHTTPHAPHLDGGVPSPRRRGHVRALLETRGHLGGFATPHVHAALAAGDGTRLAATWLRGPTPDAPAVVLAHGFAAHRRKPAYALLADHLRALVHVLTLDLRGHGQSAGASTLGDREALDVAAGVRWLRALGHRHVGVVGVSMGATSALHAAALAPEGTAGAPDQVVAVSAPARLLDPPETPPIQRLHDIWTTPWKRHGMRVALGVTVVPPAAWTAPPDPVDAAGATRAPLLVVHGEDDAYFPIADAEALAAGAGGPATLWREPAGFGHAEDGVSARLADRLGLAIRAAATTGRHPAAGG